MPEGPEIRRAADELARALQGRTVRRVFFAFEHLQPFEPILAGHCIEAVTARGKAILTRFDNDRIIYSHNQLYGRWMISAAETPPQTNRSLRLALHTEHASAWLFSASDINVLEPRDLARHPYLARLGPELLDPAVDVDAVLARLGESRFSHRCLMGLLQDQSVLAGMGNYLCCEVLHRSGLHPKQRIVDLSARQRRKLASHCLGLTRQSYRTGGITNRLTRARNLRGQGVSFEESRFLVYRRAGQPCYTCGTPIVKDRFCGRMGYLCPACQPAAQR